MTTARFKCFLVILSFLLALNLTNSRYIKTRTENELSKKAPTNDLEDDVDLETFLEDYYDNLWQYIESWVGDPGKNKKKKKEGVDRGNSDFMDYDYMSDMPAGEPEVDGKKFKNSEGDLKGDGKENLTRPSVNEPGVNDNNGDGGIPDFIKANRESNSQEEYPLRSKQMRLKSIIDQVLSFRGGSPKLNVTIPDVKQYNALREIYEKNSKKFKNEEWSSSYTEKVQSFYPSCDLPRNTDESVWADPNSMNLLFDLDYPSPSENSTVMVVTAKLRLYKLPQENYSFPSAETKWEKNQNYYGIHPVEEDRQIRVSIYWYTKSLRHQRVKKKLLDSQMMSLYAGKWTEFNIRTAVRTWKESGKNFGLVVNVEDEDGTLLPAKQYIQTMNCSKWTATARPIPSIIMDRGQYFIDNPTDGRNETFEETKNGEDKHKTYPYQPFLYPILDLRTWEVPSSDAENMALMNPGRFINLQRKGFNVTDDSIGNFLAKNNLNLGDIMRLSRIDKSRKSETRTSEVRNSYFQNVPIGSPNRGVSEEINPKRDNEGEKEGGKVMPRIRHNRKQKDVYQKATDSRSHSDFNATDHH